ncbi:hypothetical protein DFH29DRAFT_1010053 [Suillus ampliporus]|nr:hypothetical protein DFH29DRAFT_1010053 [Suillus ampliporus]
MNRPVPAPSGLFPPPGPPVPASRPPVFDPVSLDLRLCLWQSFLDLLLWASGPTSPLPSLNLKGYYSYSQVLWTTPPTTGLRPLSSGSSGRSPYPPKLAGTPGIWYGAQRTS